MYKLSFHLTNGMTIDTTMDVELIELSKHDFSLNTVISLTDRTTIVIAPNAILWIEIRKE
jgi:exosome complex RNA-binding protein Rrp4